MAKWQELLSDLEADVGFQALPRGEQAVIRRNVLSKRLLNAEPTFGTLNPYEQVSVVDNILKGAPPAVADPKIRAIAQSVYEDKVLGGLKAGLGTFMAGFVEQSGVVAATAWLLSQANGGVDADYSAWKQLYGNDAVKLKEYLESKSALGNVGTGLGALTGFVSDALLIGAPSGAARATAAKVGQAAYKAGTMSKALAKVVLPNAADAIIGAVPWHLRAELQRIQSEQPTAWSQGGLEVAKSLGMGAATDFLVGAALTSAGVFGSMVKGTFNRKAIISNEAVTENAMGAYRRFRKTGGIPEPVYETLNADQKAMIKQRVAIADYLEDGVEDAKYEPLARTHLAANDLGMVFEPLEGGRYRVIDVGKEGKFKDRLTETGFSTLTEAQDYIGIRALEYVNSMANKSGRRAFEGGEFLKQHGWLVNRMRAFDQASIDFKTGVAAQNIALEDVIAQMKQAGALKSARTEKLFRDHWKDPNRSVISDIEASILAKNGDKFVRVDMPLRGTIIENANAGRKLFQDLPTMRVGLTEEGNALVSLGKVGNAADEAKAMDEAINIKLRGKSPMSLEDITATRLMDEGIDTIKYDDGSIQIVNPYRVRLIGTPDEAGMFLATGKAVKKFAKMASVRKDHVLHTNILTGMPESIRQALDAKSRKNIINLLTDDEAAIELSTQGFRHSLREDGKVQVLFREQGSDNTIQTTFNSYKEAMEYLGVSPGKIPAEYAPQETAIMSSYDLKLLEDGKVAGTIPDLSAFYGKFRNYADDLNAEVVFQDTNGYIARRANGDYVVDMPNSGIYQTFDSVKEARRFYEGGYKELNELAKMAERRGLNVRVRDGNWHFFDGKQTHIARNTEELKEILKRFPDGERGAPSVWAALDPQVDHEVKQVVAQMKIANRIAMPLEANNTLLFWRNVPKLSNVQESVKWWRGAQEFAGATVGVMEALTRDLKQPYFAQTFRKFKSMFSIIDRDVSVYRETLHNAFKDEAGKRLIDPKRRQAIYYWMQQQDSIKRGALTPQKVKELNDGFAAKFGKLSAHEERIVEKINEFTKELGFRLGIPMHQLIFDYMPRIRDSAASINMDATLNLADDYVKHWAGSMTAPKSLKFFAENARTQELIDLAMIDDPLEALLIYSNQGTKKLHLNPVWREFDEFLRQNRQELPDHLVNYFNTLRERMMGTCLSEPEKHLGNVIGSVFSNLVSDPKAKKDAMRVGRNFINGLMRLNVATNMWWRPWSALRNSAQIIQTLGARFGFDDMHRAVKHVMENGENVYKRMVDLGIITGVSPNIHSLKGNEVWSAFGINLDQAYESGMKWFRDADQFTRAVAYVQGELMFDDALGRYAIHKNPQKFLEESGASMIDKVYHGPMLQAINDGSPKAIATAKHEYARIIEQDTMYGYHSWESAQMFNGVVGKMFGQYGTWSVGFRNNIFNAFRNGTPVQKAAFVARYVASNTLIWTGLAAMGINAPDFIPFGGALPHSGGPLWDLTVNVTQAMNMQGPEGDMARSNIKRTLPRLVPVLGPLVNNFNRALDRSSTHGFQAWLALTGVPIRNDPPGSPVTPFESK